MATNIPPPPPSLGVVHVDTLAAALAKLGIRVPAAKVLEAINDEEAKRRTQAASGAPKRAAMLEREFAVALFLDQDSNLLTASASVISEAPKIPSGPSSITYTSTFIARLPTPTTVDLQSKARRRRLVAMAKDTFSAPQPSTDRCLARL
ncbi:hypothetical protein EW146_g10281 [Bondarzewia mesenterica]|uniref:Uncharacterized protein n=1 Tax=Bondarzewia mesenterica TaxID=1095465 RepID=A0A4S4KZZ6_9AGAM|nr:hypothetical protein EW146_g10281 [Bondarzewia mesenterica]